MLSFLADENFKRSIIRGLQRVEPELDILRVQDTEIAEAEDPIVLDFALQQNRVLITHDIKTMQPLFYQRLKNGIITPGIILIHQKLAIKTAIEDLHLIAACTELYEWINKMDFLPLYRPPTR